EMWIQDQYWFVSSMLQLPLITSAHFPNSTRIRISLQLLWFRSVTSVEDYAMLFLRVHRGNLRAFRALYAEFHHPMPQFPDRLRLEVLREIPCWDRLRILNAYVNRQILESIPFRTHRFFSLSEIDPMLLLLFRQT